MHIDHHGGWEDYGDHDYHVNYFCFEEKCETFPNNNLNFVVDLNGFLFFHFFFLNLCC